MSTMSRRRSCASGRVTWARRVDPSGARSTAQCEQRREGQADRDLQEPEPGGAAEIEIDPQGLVDRDLEGGAPGPPPSESTMAKLVKQRRKTRPARPGNSARSTGQSRCRTTGGAEAESLPRAANARPESIAERIEHHPRDERRVEEDVSEQNAGPAEDLDVARMPNAESAAASHPLRP